MHHHRRRPGGTHRGKPPWPHAAPRRCDYGALIYPGQVDGMKRGEHFEVTVDAQRITGRFVILATGVVDKLPAIADAAQAIQQGHLRICPICDAYELIDANIAVLGEGEHAVREAEFLCFSRRVTLLDLGHSIDAALFQRLSRREIRLQSLAVQQLQRVGDKWRLTQDDSAAPFDAVYAALGCHPGNELAARLGAAPDGNGALQVSVHQETTAAPSELRRVDRGLAS